MKKLLVLATLVFGMNTFAQTKAEIFAIENGLEVTLSKGESVMAKQTVSENLNVYLMAFSYTIEITYSITSDGIKVTKMENTKVTNNGRLIDMTKFRGMAVDNMSKKQWVKLVANVNAVAEETISKW